MLGSGYRPYGRLIERVGADPIKETTCGPNLVPQHRLLPESPRRGHQVGRIGLPDIQRPFVWSSAKTRDLLDSMYRGYPIGTLMFWETGTEAGTRQIGTVETGRTPQLLVVDGQQRLTSLFAVITGQLVLTKTFEEKRIRIAFRPGDERFEVADAAIDRDPEFIPDITALWSTRYNPAVRAFLHRLAESQGSDLDDGLKDELEERIDRVRDLRDFPFQVVELGASAKEDEVAEIFVRINSEGVQLKQADFILTLTRIREYRGDTGRKWRWAPL